MMRCVLLSMLEAVEGALCSLGLLELLVFDDLQLEVLEVIEVLELLEAMRCLYIWRVQRMGSDCWRLWR